jgi:membrane dipeptidase
MFIIDAHFDLSMNALEWNRDLTQPACRINAARGKALTDKPDSAKAWFLYLNCAKAISAWWWLRR